MSKQLVKRNVLGVNITNASKAEVLEYLADVLKNKTVKISIVTPNPEIVVFAQNHPEFKKLLNEADIALCDGTGLLLAGQILGKPLKERITGIDMMDSLCSLAVDQGLNIGLLGARPGMAEEVAKCLREKYPLIKINFIASEWNDEGFATAKRLMNKDKGIMSNDEEKILNPQSSILNQIDILFVAFGFPKQEEWIAEHLPKLPVKLAMGVGGSFDILSGDIRRAPFIIRMVGFEWLYRLARQPWRWRRQMALLSFLKLVFVARMSL